MRVVAGCATLLVAVLAVLQGTQVDAFIKVLNGKFVDSNTCEEVFFMGWNTWQLIDEALGQGKSGQGPSMVSETLDKGVAANMTLMRMFGHASQCGVLMQPSPGVYNETVLQAFDFVISEATKRKMYLLITFGNNWWDPICRLSDTRAYYTNQTTTAKSPDDFYSNNQTIEWYKNHISFILNRTNTITGKKYRDEQYIFAWNLMNEPRCDEKDCEKKMLAWGQIMADHFKKENPNQLVTFGQDGFYAKTSCLASDVNPSPWAGETGQDFLPHHAIRSIDFAAIHLWPKNWARTDNEFVKYWLGNHTLNAKQLGKPLLLEEVGARYEQRNSMDPQQEAFYKLVYADVEKSITDGDWLKGVAFWRWIERNTPGYASDEFAVSTDSGTYQNVIQPAVTRVARLNRKNKVPGCTVPSTSNVAIASVQLNTSSLPGPEDFLTPDPNSLNKTCYAFYGNVDGSVKNVINTTSAGACCASCTGPSCSGWAYCYCQAGCGNFTFGSCLLKELPRPFYPTVKISSGWISGTPNPVPKPSWLCQPTGECAGNGTCTNTQFNASLVCPNNTCTARQANLGGDVITLDVNSQSPTKKVFSAADCCSECSKTRGCNTWTYCPLAGGCASGCRNYVATTSPNPFGPYGGCQDDAFPANACTLKTSADVKNVQVYEQGELQPWVSGVLGA